MQPAIYGPGDRAVAVIIRDGAIVLIHRQKRDRAYYVLPGGSIEADETPAAACGREVAEETGLVVRGTTYLCTLSNQGRAEHYFLVEVEHDRLVLGGPERERHTTDNQYQPVWIDRTTMTTLNIQPPELRQLILTHL
ncbi:MAG: NUDIX domain-containing protein [Chloroflexota bacterium]|nr:NUDIX domain-containing protein [Chloroflexota bacterium]